MYQVNHFSYCGMRDVPASFDTAEEARDYAARRIRRYRRHFVVTTLDKGARWEVLEPDDCVMVPDACGTLELEHVTYECRECGHAHDAQADALHCCTEDFFDEVNEFEDDEDTE